MCESPALDFYDVAVMLTDRLSAHLFMVLLILVAGPLPEGHVFNSDRSLSVQRAGPGGFELTAPVPRLELLVHYLLWETSGAVVWMVPLSRGESDVSRQRPLCSLVRHSSSLFIVILISAGRAGSLLGVVAPCQVQIRLVDHFFIVIGFRKTGAGLVPGIMVEASAWEGWRSVAANWARVRERRLILFGQITGRLLTGRAVVGCKRVFRVAVLRVNVVSIVHRGGRSLW